MLIDGSNSILQNLPLTIVDNMKKVATMVDTLHSLPIDTPHIAVDIEGKDLGRYGKVYIVIVHDCKQNWTYLVDIVTLCHRAFITPGKRNPKVTLQTILEAAAIPKLLWDIRSDSEGLYHGFEIKCDGIVDVQLVQLATSSQRRYRNGLDKVIGWQANFMTDEEKKAWQNTKNVGKALWCPKRGGTFAAFTERPMPRPIVMYCVGDVKYLQKLYSIYWPRLSQEWKTRIASKTAQLIAETWKDNPYNSGALGPW
jgi:exonuclease 3'-5' domain-containing protein 1